MPRACGAARRGDAPATRAGDRMAESGAGELRAGMCVFDAHGQFGRELPAHERKVGEADARADVEAEDELRLDGRLRGLALLRGEVFAEAEEDILEVYLKDRMQMGADGGPLHAVRRCH